MQVKGQKNSRVPALRNRRAKPAGVLRKELDPSFYKSLSSFRRAVQDGSVDVSKACRNMDEYHWSLERRLITAFQTIQTTKGGNDMKNIIERIAGRRRGVMVA
ncbi:MAG: hypothetical protein IJG18_08090 [Kiritimatiellae bacterium]|nr:hypothetical protein [Kiritimatiellia bacterium]